MILNLYVTEKLMQERNNEIEQKARDAWQWKIGKKSNTLFAGWKSKVATFMKKTPVRPAVCCCC